MSSHITQDERIIHRSDSLRAIRRYLRLHTATYVDMYSYEDGTGLLYIQFANGARGSAGFMDYNVLSYTVANWSKLRTAPKIRHFRRLKRI